MIQDAPKEAGRELREESPLVNAWLRIFEEAQATENTEEPPEGEGWEQNVHRGRDGWERFEYHEEAYWMRRLKEVAGE